MTFLSEYILQVVMHLLKLFHTITGSCFKQDVDQSNKK